MLFEGNSDEEIDNNPDSESAKQINKRKTKVERVMEKIIT